MAGVKGMAMANPGQVETPQSSGDELDAALAGLEHSAPAAAPQDELDAALAQTEAPAPPAEFQSPVYTKYLPAAGGLAGGIVGGVGGTLFGMGFGGLPGATGGAALGGAAGQSFRDLIEINVLGRPENPSVLGRAQDIAGAGAVEGASQLVGHGIAKVGGKVLGTLTEGIAKPAKEFVVSTLKGVKDAIEEPIMKIVASKATPLNTEAAGDTVKQLFGEDIKTRFGGFVNTYGKLEGVANSLPMRENEMLVWRTKQYDEALKNLGGDNFKMVKKYLNDLTEAGAADGGNMQRFSDVVRQIKSQAASYGKDLQRSQAKALFDLADSAEGFMDKQIAKLAENISNGKATPTEMDGFMKMMEGQIDPKVPADPKRIAEYTRSVAKDFIKERETVNGAYAKFRSFLSDVGEQTKINADGLGPRQFLSAIGDVPSEKLIERMFDPKNAAALRAMQQESPAVFDMVAKSKMNQLIQKSSPEGTFDLMKFRKQAYALPESTRQFLFSPEDLKTLNSVVNNPRLARLKSLEKMGNNMVSKWAQDVAEVAKILGEKSAESPVLQGAAAGAKQVAGKAGNDFLSYMLPKEQK